MTSKNRDTSRYTLIERGTLVATCGHIEFEKPNRIYGYSADMITSVVDNEGNTVEIQWLLMCVPYRAHYEDGVEFDAITAVVPGDVVIDKLAPNKETA